MNEFLEAWKSVKSRYLNWHDDKDYRPDCNICQISVALEQHATNLAAVELLDGSGFIDRLLTAQPAPSTTPGEAEEYTVHCALCGVPEGDQHDADCPYREVTYDFAGPGEPKAVEPEPSVGPLDEVEEARKTLVQRLLRITCDTVLIGNAHIVELSFSDALSVYEATLRAALSRGAGKQQSKTPPTEEGWYWLYEDNEQATWQCVFVATTPSVPIVMFASGRRESLANIRGSWVSLPAPPSPLAQEAVRRIEAELARHPLFD